jgi:2-succinyl-6-hydroxy-2,4-cyclohexadiene-1-carboxylate synthase
MTDWRPLAGPLAAHVRGRGPRVVFVHGFTQTGRSWVPIADLLAARGYETVVVDLPGHGGSSRLRADLRRAADLLAATSGPATYVGYSLGGRVGLHLGLMFPHIAERLVLLGATPGIIDDEERANRRAADEQLAERIIEIGVEAFIDEWIAQPLFAGLTLTPSDRADRLTNTAEGLASSLRMAGTGTQVPLWDRLHGFATPILALAGANDAKFSAIAEQMASLAPDAEWDTVAHAGHAAHLQQPAAVADRIEQFLPTVPGIVG